MATAIITITDDEEGFTIRAEFDPPLPETEAEATIAQLAAVGVVDTLFSTGETETLFTERQTPDGVVTRETPEGVVTLTPLDPDVDRFVAEGGTVLPED